MTVRQNTQNSYMRTAAWWDATQKDAIICQSVQELAPLNMFDSFRDSNEEEKGSLALIFEVKFDKRTGGPSIVSRERTLRVGLIAGDAKECFFDTNVTKHSYVQKRLSNYNWTPGPRRGVKMPSRRTSKVGKQIGGQWHVTTVQEASEYVCVTFFQIVST